jgi:LacI family transcriptional regulator
MYFGDTVKTRGYKQRWLAFREAMKREGIEVCEESHLIRWPLSGSIPSEHVEWAEQFRMSLELSQTTALICAPYGHLPWIFYACSEAGLRIPQDISVIMLDNCRESFMQDVTRPEFLEMETGFRAADRMLWRIANPHMPFEHIRLQGTFYEGATVMKKQQA